MKISNRKKIMIIILILLLIPISFLAYKTLAGYKKESSGEAPASAAVFIIKINDSTAVSQTITLSDTITPNSYTTDLVVPGAEGIIELELDFTGTEVSTDYIIDLNTSNLPNNLKLYSDSSYQNEINQISDSFIYGSTAVVTKNIYWQWEYKTDDTSNENDNLFMDTEIVLPIDITLSQKIGGGN